jgi:hypothetical protein
LLGGEQRLGPLAVIDPKSYATSDAVAFMTGELTRADVAA